MSDNTKYSITDVSRHFDLTTRTIRFYESEGLLNPERINGHRIYHEREMVRLKLILRGKRLGFSLAEIKTTMKLYDTQPNEATQLNYVLETIQAHRIQLQQKQMDIINTLDEMRGVEKKLQKTLKELLQSGPV